MVTSMKYLFLDFNGTILDDVDLCLDLLNEILNKQHHEPISKEKYRHIFTFPIIDYYRAAGVDFTKDSYEDLAIWFVKKYQPLSYKQKLYPDLIDTLKELNEMDYRVIVLSASEKNNLIDQLKMFNIYDYFYDVIGLDNIHAASKIKLGIDYIIKNRINSNDCIMLGDTLHDAECANAMDIRCVLFGLGHQDIDVLKTAGLPIITSYKDLKKILE